MGVVREEGEYFRAVDGEGQAVGVLAKHQVVGVRAAEDAAEADALAGEEGAVERVGVTVGEAGKVPTGGGLDERGRVGEGVGLPVRVGRVVARGERGGGGGGVGGEAGELAAGSASHSIST